MSLLKAILISNFEDVFKYIQEGADVNSVINGNPPMSMLDVAIQTLKENDPKDANIIVFYLKSKGALTYEELNAVLPRSRLPPLATKRTSNTTIKKYGIASLPRRGGRTRRSHSRKNRR